MKENGRTVTIDNKCLEAVVRLNVISLKRIWFVLRAQLLVSIALKLRDDSAYYLLYGSYYNQDTIRDFVRSQEKKDIGADNSFSVWFNFVEANRIDDDLARLVKRSCSSMLNLFKVSLENAVATPLQMRFGTEVIDID